MNEVDSKTTRATPDKDYLTFGTIKKGSRGADVKFAQTMLNVFLGFPEGLVADGIFGDTTAMYVKQFQNKCNLTADGIVGSGTWRYLGPTLSTSYSAWNAKKAISLIQTGMKSVGRYTGTIDGVWGNGTENAVKSFQNVYGLDVDGKWGRQCWSVYEQGYR